ncbi:periplasmic nitrate reductase subunit NapB [Colwellia chukchiensis]|uniref:Periplasmic nitrate reductase, electron transfer subunit n=1 Tax=Colwellia chukchiensis TaxID=641665 RepID=A0A1H7G4G5_9GAMM|nr:nitrate reductase cytochrome c-type subunit [Colwellia chukchiensis]SEK32954.1 periplasmic nitrate reductase subunit NapB [Colwellia chukchiensis]
MKLLTLAIAVVSTVIVLSVTAQETVNPGGLATIRGVATIDETRPAEKLKRVIKDKNPIARNYVHQPPVVPHQIRGYRVDLNSNKCLSCHSWKYAAETGATKISLTHFETRDGKTLSDVSPRRYFCSQCHVTQADAAPLVDNTFEPVESLGNE